MNAAQAMRALDDAEEPHIDPTTDTESGLVIEYIPGLGVIAHYTGEAPIGAQVLDAFRRVQRKAFS